VSGVVALAALTRPSGRVEPLDSPAAHWAHTTSEWPVQGRFAFFVFQVRLCYDCAEWFPGLQTHWVENDLFVGGTVDQWDSACYALLKRDHPHDCCTVFRFVYTTLTDFGYTLRGTRTSQAKKFYLK
jgi:hypothetical protein